MRLFFLLAIYLLGACNSFKKDHSHFKKIIPDSTGGFYSKQFHNDYLSTRQVVDSLKLQDITNGVNNEQIWFWNLSSAYDPQTIYILQRNSTTNWNLRFLQYDANSKKAIVDRSKSLNGTFFDSLKFKHLWDLPSQSELKDGDRYGCLDGNTVLIEIADSTRYKYIAYRCPGIHVNKDSAFYYVNEISQFLDQAGRTNQ